MSAAILKAAATAAAAALVLTACLDAMPDERTVDMTTGEVVRPNGSTDGRYHTCGYVTPDGVTEYLDAYKARCG